MEWPLTRLRCRSVGGTRLDLAKLRVVQAGFVIGRSVMDLADHAIFCWVWRNRVVGIASNCVLKFTFEVLINT